MEKQSDQIGTNETDSDGEDSNQYQYWLRVRQRDDQSPVHKLPDQNPHHKPIRTIPTCDSHQKPVTKRFTRNSQPIICHKDPGRKKAVMVEASEKEMEGPNEFDDGVEVQYSPEEAEAVEAGREQEPSASPLQNLTPTTDTHTLRRSIRERRPTHMVSLHSNHTLASMHSQCPVHIPCTPHLTSFHNLIKCSLTPFSCLRVPVL